VQVFDGIRMVASITDFEPENTDYELSLMRLFDEHEQSIFASKPWTFAEQDADVTIYPDYTTGTIDVTNGSHQVLGTSTTWALAMVGAWLLAPNGKWYRIGRVASTTVLYLEQKYDGPNDNGDTYTLRWRFYAGPRNMVDFLGVACRGGLVTVGVKDQVVSAPGTRRPIMYISRAEEQGYPLTEEQTGPPSIFLEAPVWRQRSPDQALTATAVSAGGTLTSGTVYRYRYTWMLHGAESAPSLEVSVTTASGAGARRVDLTGITEATALVPRTARVYRAEGKQGTFYLLEEGTFAAGTYSDVGDEVDREQPLEPEGTYQYLRFWPRPATAETVCLRYHARPRRLSKLTDSFNLPTEYHKMLVDIVLGDVLWKHGDQAGSNFYRKRAREKMEEMEDRCLSHAPDLAVRQVWTGGPRPRLIGPIRRIG
jgi:hypothetical protein